MNITCVRENVIHDFNSRLEKRKKMEQRKRESWPQLKQKQANMADMSSDSGRTEVNVKYCH